MKTTNKKELIDKIKNILKEHNVESFSWVNIDEGSSPIIQDAKDSDFIFTLDSIDEEGVWASNCWENDFWGFYDLNVNILKEIAEGLVAFDWDSYNEI